VAALAECWGTSGCAAGAGAGAGAGADAGVGAGAGAGAGGGAACCAVGGRPGFRYPVWFPKLATEFRR